MNDRQTKRLPIPRGGKANNDYCIVLYFYGARLLQYFFTEIIFAGLPQYLWHSRRKSTFRRQKRKMSFLYQKIALTSFYPMVLVALQYPFVSLSYKRSRPRSYTAEERRNQANKSQAMFPFTSVKRSRWSDHTHIIPGSRALR